MKYYFFNSNFNFLIEKIKNVIGVWDDLNSTLLLDLLKKHYGDYYIEESLFNHYQQFVDVKPFQVVKSVELKKYEIDHNEIFFLSNDTISRMFKNILLSEQYFNKKNILISKLKQENELVEINKMGKKYLVFEECPSFETYKSIVLGNDWGPIEKRIIDIFRMQGKYSFCLQESVIDFSDGSQRMKYCDIPLIQGSVTIRSLKRNIYALTGNPRYENIQFKPWNEKAPVIINSNFTYGISTGFKDEWLSTIINILKELNIDYLIVRHPRDISMGKHNQNIMESNASIIHDILSKGSLLITRFSSLIHESLHLGRPVIYYNSMGEDFNYDFEFNNKFLFHTKNKTELKKALSEIFQKKIFNEEVLDLKDYLRNHCGRDSIKPTNKVMNFLSLFESVENRVFVNKINKLNLLKNFFVYHKLKSKSKC